MNNLLPLPVLLPLLGAGRAEGAQSGDTGEESADDHEHHHRPEHVAVALQDSRFRLGHACEYPTRPGRVRRVAPGLSSRYEAPGRPPESDWDQLTAGEDPTDVVRTPRT